MDGWVVGGGGGGGEGWGSVLGALGVVGGVAGAGEGGHLCRWMGICMHYHGLKGI